MSDPRREENTENEKQEREKELRGTEVWGTGKLNEVHNIKIDPGFSN